MIRLSVVASTLEVASSRTRIRGSVNRARAIATRCRWPPDRVRPRSPTSVSSPSGSESMSSPRPAREAALEHLVATGVPARMRCCRGAMPRNRNASSDTTATWPRSEAGSSERTSAPSTRTLPSETS